MSASPQHINLEVFLPQEDLHFWRPYLKNRIYFKRFRRYRTQNEQCLILQEKKIKQQSIIEANTKWLFFLFLFLFTLKMQHLSTSIAPSIYLSQYSLKKKKKTRLEFKNYTFTKSDKYTLCHFLNKMLVSWIT